MKCLISFSSHMLSPPFHPYKMSIGFLLPSSSCLNGCQVSACKVIFPLLTVAGEGMLDMFSLSNGGEKGKKLTVSGLWHPNCPWWSIWQRHWESLVLHSNSHHKHREEDAQGPANGTMLYFCVTCSTIATVAAQILHDPPDVNIALFHA